jgi:Activator of Hsp90 ATPase homolog 1-like protein
MTRSIIHQPDPKLDLVFERIVDVPRELIWTAWTTPEQLKQWFTPAPWKTVDCEEIVENEKLVWTNALVPGFRPKAPEAASCVTFFGMVQRAAVQGNTPWSPFCHKAMNSNTL